MSTACNSMRWTAASAAQIDDYCARLCYCRGVPNQEFTPAARHEDATVDGDPLPTELGPTEHLFQGQAGDSLLDKPCKVGRRQCRVDQQRCLILGKDAAGRAQASDNGGQTRLVVVMRDERAV